MSKPKILIIDDDETTRDSMSRLLSREGYEAFSAADGREGLSVLKKVSPILVILDLDMPVLDGFGFLEELRIKPEDPFFVTVLTGTGDHEVMERCYKLGVNSFMRKPYNLIELGCVVKRSIDLKRLQLQQREHDHLDKMASLGIMAAGVAHELNNVISIIKGDIHLIKENYSSLLEYINELSNIPIAPDVAEDVRALRERLDIQYIIDTIGNKCFRCETAVERAVDTVQNMKFFSHLDKGDVNAVDINEGIKSALKIIPKDITQNVKINMKLAPLPEIPCYGRQINQVFLNLITNSCRAMRNCGELTIETSTDDHHAYISFCDNGPNVPEGRIKSIFDTDLMKKKLDGGLYTRLFISHAIVEKHGGDITVVNNEGKGVTFTVKLLREGVLVPFRGK